MNTSAAVSVLGFALAIAGVVLLWGVGAGCLTAGVVLFLAGGLASQREAR